MTPYPFLPRWAVINCNRAVINTILTFDSVQTANWYNVHYDCVMSFPAMHITLTCPLPGMWYDSRYYLLPTWMNWTVINFFILDTLLPRSLHTCMKTRIITSLVPRPPPFFGLRFAFSVIHRSGRATEDLGTLTMWMMSGIHGCEMDVGGRGEGFCVNLRKKWPRNKGR